MDRSNPPYYRFSGIGSSCKLVALLWFECNGFAMNNPLEGQVNIGRVAPFVLECCDSGYLLSDLGS